MIRRFSPIFPLFLLAAALGCASEEGLLVQPPFEDGKADVNDRVIDRGPLGYDAPVAGEFTEDLEFHGYHLQARAGAVVTLDVTRTGSSRNLDSSLFVYGPRRAEDGFGSEAIAFDDDAGWGRLSRIRSFTFDLEGEYLVVIGTANARGRGRYRLEARCESGDCLPAEPPPAGLCPAAFVEAIEACVADGAEGDELDPRDLLEQCANVEVIAPAFDALCAGEDAPAELCARSLDELSREELPTCFSELWSHHLDTSCVFGATYREVFRSGAIVVLSRDVLRVGATLTPVETAQVIAAVDVSSWDPTTLAEAFEAVDGGEINRTELWDASNRRGFVAYEYGAGDNSYGAIFEHGTTIVAARIQDGDLYGCETTWGPERRECDTDAACAEGLRCVGVTEPIGRGRCVDLSATHPAEESSCSAESPCPAGSGLQCQGAAFGGEGLCRPAWLTGSFEVSPMQPIADGGSTEVSLVAYGLATVDVEVRLDLWIDHPRTSDLRVTLTNPSGNELLIADGVEGREIDLRDELVRGLSGDEDVNGVWTLRVVDAVRGEAGTIFGFRLTITSRWD
ncbi:MAG: proprotein convertase P-domain-containing protein [Myxococcales bacterium]|nr:proprotein convertase P-domain-containing protein [Myxococcales bacterium]